MQTETIEAKQTLQERSLARHAKPLRESLLVGYESDSPFARVLSLLSDEELLATCPPMFVAGHRKRATL